MTTSRDFVNNLAPVQLDRLRAIFQYLATNASELRTEDGGRLCDSSDWTQFFREAAARLAERERVSA
jgi:hypothetical protein